MSAPGPGERRFHLWLLAIATLGLTLRLVGLPHQPLTDDDRAVAYAAANYAYTGHLGPTMWNHPHLWNLTVFAAMRLLGGGVLSLKLMSLLLGSVSILLLGLVGRRLLPDARAALLAAFLLALDPLHLDFSRQAVHEVHMMAFSLLGLWATLRYLDRRRLAWLALAGAAFGLGLASKWYVAFVLLPAWALAVHRVTRPGQPERAGAAAAVTAGLALVPLAVYVASFLPWFAGGHGLGEWLQLQGAMLHESLVHQGYNAYQHELDTKAWLWFVKPVAYVDVAFGAGEPTVLVGIAAPLVWLLTLPAAGFAAHAAWRQRHAGLALVVALFLCSYLPFLLSSRPQWAHSAFAPLPFALLLVAHGVVTLAGRRRRPRRWLVGYALAVTLVALPLYLLATGHGLELGPLRPIAMWYRPHFER